MKKIVLSQHAQKRMEERGITLRMIRLTLLCGEKRVNKDKETYLFIRDNVVIVASLKTENKIITVHMSSPKNEKSTNKKRKKDKGKTVFYKRGKKYYSQNTNKYNFGS